VRVAEPFEVASRSSSGSRGGGRGGVGVEDRLEGGVQLVARALGVQHALQQHRAGPRGQRARVAMPAAARRRLVLLVLLDVVVAGHATVQTVLRGRETRTQ